MIRPNEPPAPPAAIPGPHHFDCLLADSGYRGDEIALLDVIRHILLCFADPLAGHQERALAVAAKYFPGAGEDICVEILTMVRALRDRRFSPFDFSFPHCPICRMQLTPCERQLMEMLRATRWREGASARTYALMLCEGGDGTRLVAAARELVFVVAAHLENNRSR